MTAHPPLRQALGEYLSLRRALGFKLASTGRLLGQFLDYLDRQQATTLTVAHTLAWATSPSCPSTTWHAMRLSTVRGFAVYLHSLDASVVVPPAYLLRHGNDRATPYLYSDAEIRSLITAAGRLQPAFRATTYQTLIGVLAATGLRISEAIALDTDDLDPADGGHLLVRQTKFGKDRLVPLHPSTTRALLDYLNLRDRQHPHPRCPALLVSTVGTRLELPRAFRTGDLLRSFSRRRGNRVPETSKLFSGVSDRGREEGDRVVASGGAGCSGARHSGRNVG
jgi:integrase/recombinase XerD